MPLSVHVLNASASSPFTVMVVPAVAHFADCEALGASDSSAMALAGAVMAANSVATAAIPATHVLVFIVLLLMEYG